MHTIERNVNSEFEQKLLNPIGQGNSIKIDVVAVVVVVH